MPLSDVAPVMRKAVIAIEDSRFYEHGGIDLRGTVRALRQQPVRQGRPGWLDPDPAVRQAGAARDRAPTSRTRRSAPRRRRPRPSSPTPASCASCATRSRWRRSTASSEILERYLNIAYFGAGAYGVEAAAKRLLQHPRPRPDPAAGRAARRHRAAADRVRPDPQPGRARWPAATSCSRRMAEVGLHPQAEADAAKATPLGLKPPKRVGQNGCQDSKVAVLLRLRPQDDPQRQDVRRQARGPGPAAAARRPDHHHHPRPQMRRPHAQQALADHVNPTRRGRLRAGRRCSPAPGRSRRWR